MNTIEAQLEAQMPSEAVERIRVRRRWREFTAAVQRLGVSAEDAARNLKANSAKNPVDIKSTVD